jgi:Spy/CpxP family protein refolding chaperone
MNSLRKFVVVSAALALSAVALVKTPMAASPDQTGPAKGGFTHGARMHGAVAFGAPLITIALNHKTELNLSPDQVANLENIRSHYQSQVTPIQQQLVSSEKEIASLMQQSPANLIQIKSKIQETEKYRSDLRYLRIEALENGRSVLSQQQQDQLKTLVRSRHGNFRGPQGQPS